ncbi:MAG: hypothetical protein IJ336_07085 [Lachnospiraceae bacterium]|nr:hypothetical protein [Lachnospiraceae bacterium]
MSKKAYQDKKIYEFQPGEVIFSAGDDVEYLAMLAEGEMAASASYGAIVLKAGDMAGISDIWQGKYSCDYMAVTKVKVCMYAFGGASLMRPVFDGERKYLSVSALSAIRFYKQQNFLQNQWYQRSKRAYGKLKLSYEKYNNYTRKYNITPQSLEYIEELESEYQTYSLEGYTEAVASELSSFSLEEIQNFLGKAPYFAMGVLKQLEERCRITANVAEKSMLFYKKIGQMFFGANRETLYTGYYEMALAVKEINGDIQPLVMELESILNMAQTMEKEFAEAPGVHFISPVEKIRDAIGVLYTSAEAKDAILMTDYTANQMMEAQKAFAGLTKKLLDYADITGEQRQEFMDGLTAFRMLAKNQFRAADSVKIIHEFETLFYELYEAIFKKKEKEGAPFWVQLFLDYGILSDTDFSKEDQVRIYDVVKNRSYEGDYKIYTISQWLHLIYIGEREPSRDELGRDYKEFLQEFKKKRTLTHEEEMEFHNDMMRKVRFEIKNFFRINSRIVYSSNSTFCPFITGEELGANIANSILSYEKTVEVMEKIRKVDFSIFYREYTYYNSYGQVKSLRLMTEVLPDIILIPHVGYRAGMWQEIEGRKRVSPARFAVPMYPQGDLYEMLLNVAGRYRWEFCRTEQGVRWNDVSERSLTSEYFDYIQFYRKNNELSDGNKQKLKDKLTRFRNNTSEVFISDYVAWIKYESEGANRLNKVCRNIMAEYCLFGKEIRDRLKTNPMFGESLAKAENKRNQRQKEFERYILSLQTKGIEPGPELLEHLKFLQA